MYALNRIMKPLSRKDQTMNNTSSNPQGVIVGIAVFIKTTNGVPLMLRQGSHGAGLWSLPGGKMEFGETVEETAIREVMEEFGINIKNVKKIPYFSEDFFPEAGKHFITIYLSAFSEEVPQIMEPDKASEIMLVSASLNASELPKNLFCAENFQEAWRVFQRQRLFDVF